MHNDLSQGENWEDAVLGEAVLSIISMPLIISMVSYALYSTIPRVSKQIFDYSLFLSSKNCIVNLPPIFSKTPLVGSEI